MSHSIVQRNRTAARPRKERIKELLSKSWSLALASQRRSKDKKGEWSNVLSRIEEVQSEIESLEEEK